MWPPHLSMNLLAYALMCLIGLKTQMSEYGVDGGYAAKLDACQNVLRNTNRNA